MINISMEWTDTGAKICSSMSLPCPVCGLTVTPNVEHTCGDMAKPAPKPRRKRKQEAPHA